jgi:hypothetical protein
MKKRFGAAFDTIPLSKKGASSKFMMEFETQKRNFGSSKYAKTYRMHLKMKAPESKWFDADDEEVLLTSNDMKELFDPVVSKIIGLLEQQIQATKDESSLDVNIIVLVGGFGESPYLFDKLKEWCPSGIQLVNPPKSWEAICIGAAVRGLEGPIVVQKKSKVHIGFPLGRLFREGVDDEDDSYVDFEGKKKVTGYMHWDVARVSNVRYALLI